MTWAEEASAFVREFAPKVRAFSANDLWEAGLRSPGNRRNLARVLLRLEREGAIRRRGKTRSIGGHGQLIVVWEAVS